MGYVPSHCKPEARLWAPKRPVSSRNPGGYDINTHTGFGRRACKVLAGRRTSDRERYTIPPNQLDHVRPDPYSLFLPTIFTPCLSVCVSVFHAKMRICRKIMQFWIEIYFKKTALITLPRSEDNELFLEILSRSLAHITVVRNGSGVAEKALLFLSRPNSWNTSRNSWTSSNSPESCKIILCAPISSMCSTRSKQDLLVYSHHSLQNTSMEKTIAL